MIPAPPVSGKPDRLDPPRPRPHDRPGPSPFPRDNFDAYLDDPGAYVLPAGPCKGKRLDQLPDDFLHYVAAKNWHVQVRELAELVIRQRAEDAGDREDDEPEPDPTPAAVALPGVVFRWWRAMADEFGDDALALEVVNAGLAKLKALCSEFTRKGWSAEGGADR